MWMNFVQIIALKIYIILQIIKKKKDTTMIVFSIG